ncbi:MAG: DUF2304 domain-containing protein [bacterium]
MLIKLIIILFVLFVFGRMVKKLKKKEITSKEFLGWGIFWIIVAAAAIWPRTTDMVAYFVGVERGSNLAIYISILVLFYLAFKFMAKADEIDRNITKIVRKIAIDRAEEEREIKKFTP